MEGLNKSDQYWLNHAPEGPMCDNFEPIVRHGNDRIEICRKCGHWEDEHNVS